MRKITIGLIVFGLLIAFVACSSPASTPAVTTSTATPTPTIVPTPTATPEPTPTPTPSPTPTPMPATFQVSEIQLLPISEGGYSISAVISNIGDESGTYIFQVSIDNEPLQVFGFELDGVKCDNPDSENNSVRVDLDAKETRTFTESASTYVQILFMTYHKEFGYHILKLDNEEKQFRVDNNEIKGAGDSVTQPIYLPGGLTVLTLYHWGNSNFIVHLLDSKGQTIDFLVNEIGTYHGTVSVTLSPGSYRLGIKADGSWAVYYSYVQ